MAAKKHNMFRSKARLAFNVQEAQQHDYIFFNNPVFVQGYALACAVGGAVDLQTAAVLALAGCMLIIPVRLLGELAVGRIKARLRMLFYVGVGAVLSVPMLIVIYRIFGVEAVLAGIFLPLLFVDGAVTWRAGESKREGARVVLRGALSSAAGGVLALLLIGGVRELLGKGALWETALFSRGVWPAAQTLPGGFIITALLAAFWQYLSAAVKRLLFIGGREEDD